VKTLKKALFVCVKTAGRNQMMEASQNTQRRGTPSELDDSASTLSYTIREIET
jgi:hypothetical protein